jgi:putative endonuclease
MYNIQNTIPDALINMDSTQYWIYIMTDEGHRRLYTGRTSNLKRRVAQHRSGNGGVFTRRYSLVKLVYYELVEDAEAARQRERQVKQAGKKKRVSLIERMNPCWEDLFFDLSAEKNPKDEDTQ